MIGADNTTSGAVMAPHNIEAEQALLGAILMNNDAYECVEGRLQAGDFFEPIHRTIYEVAGQLIRTGKPANAITLKSYLPADLDVAGLTLGMYLARLSAESTTIINAPDYAADVRELADQRRVIEVAEGVRASVGGGASASELATDAIGALDEIVASRADTATPPIMLGDALHDANERLTLARANPGALGGITTGLRSLDHFIDGIHAGELLVIGARPSMGKTGLAASVSRMMAEAGHSGMFFSLEMGSGSIADRVLADRLYDRGSPSYWDLRRGAVGDAHAAAVVESMRNGRDLPLLIDPSAGLTVSQIASRARRHARALKRKGRALAFVVVDHIHIVRPNDRYRGNRTSEMAEISGALKALAKELDTAVIALAQLNRGVEGRDDKRPTMADLRDSGSIEQDADTIIFLFREEYYLQRTQFSSPADEDRRVARLAEVRNVLELIVAKQRNGPIGTQRIFFDAARNAARDLDRGDR